jgi:hypothetical protein
MFVIKLSKTNILFSNEIINGGVLICVYYSQTCLRGGSRISSWGGEVLKKIALSGGRREHF